MTTTTLPRALQCSQQVTIEDVLETRLLTGLAFVKDRDKSNLHIRRKQSQTLALPRDKAAVDNTPCFIRTFPPAAFVAGTAARARLNLAHQRATKACRHSSECSPSWRIEAYEGVGHVRHGRPLENSSKREMFLFVKTIFSISSSNGQRAGNARPTRTICRAAPVARTKRSQSPAITVWVYRRE